MNRNDGARLSWLVRSRWLPHVSHKGNRTGFYWVIYRRFVIGGMPRIMWNVCGWSFKMRNRRTSWSLRVSNIPYGSFANWLSVMWALNCTGKVRKKMRRESTARRERCWWRYLPISIVPPMWLIFGEIHRKRDVSWGGIRERLLLSNWWR